MHASDYSFDQVIAPIDAADFFADYYEKNNLLVRRGQRDYYSELLTLDDIDLVITSMSLLGENLTIARADKTIKSEDYLYDSGVVDPSRVFQLFADGATIILPHLHLRLPKLAALARSLEATFSSRFQTNIYLTPGRSQGFKKHYDSHDVLVLQIAGSKVWRIYDTPVELPLFSQAFTAGAPIGEMTDSFTLEAGDMLYVPRGVAHDAVATDETSLHITTGIMAKSWTDLMTDAVVRLARREPAFRKALPAGFAGADFDRSAARAYFTKLADLLKSEGSLDEALDAFVEDILATRAPLLRGQLRDVMRLDAIDADTTLRARPDLMWRLSEAVVEPEDAEDAEEGGSPVLRLECYGVEIDFPIATRDAVRYALSSRMFKPRDLPGLRDDASKIVLARRLVREGLAQLV